MLISKIISGGQTGVDRGAIEAALELGFPYGGLIPKGRLAEDGAVPEKFDRMEVAPRKDYLFRTEWNVTHSDATLIIARKVARAGAFHEELTGGTLRTENFAAVHAKPRLVLFEQNVEKVVEWLEKLAAANGCGIVLNVAGPRESKNPGIQESTRRFITQLLTRIMEAERGAEPKKIEQHNEP
jgi:hypothetical protein